VKIEKKATTQQRVSRRERMEKKHENEVGDARPPASFNLTTRGIVPCVMSFFLVTTVTFTFISISITMTIFVIDYQAHVNDSAMRDRGQ
jgi:hypothetical protein